MRAITPGQVLTFVGLFILILLSTGLVTYAGLSAVGAVRLDGVLAATTFAVTLYVVAIVIYRLFLRLFPLTAGILEPGSRGEFAAQVNILFYLILFNSIIRTHFLPVPVMRLVYIGLGAKLGKNSYSAGVLLDPALTTVGDNCIIGHDAVIYAHVIEGAKMALAPVHIGHRVTIGAHAIVMSGVDIGDDAIVSAGAVVLKETRIGKGEIWGGVPARRLRSLPELT